MRANFRRTTPAFWPNTAGHALTAHRNTMPWSENAFQVLLREVKAMRGVEQSAVLLLDLLGVQLRAALALNNMGAVQNIAMSLGAKRDEIVAAVVA